VDPTTGTRRVLIHPSLGCVPTTHDLYYKLKGHCGEQGVSLCDKSLHIPEKFCCWCRVTVGFGRINMCSCELGGAFDGLFSVDCPIARAKMFRFPKLLILLVVSSDIPVVALPAPTRVASSAARLVYYHKNHGIAGQTRSSIFYAFCHSIFMGRAGVIPLSTAIANESHPVLVSKKRRHSDLALWILIVLCDCTSRLVS
jgi:hypothetical protein